MHESFFFKLLNFLNLDMFGFVRWEWTTRAYFQMLNIWKYSILELRVAYNEILTGWVLGLIVSDERHQFFPPQSSLCFQNIRKINLRQSVLTQYQHINTCPLYGVTNRSFLFCSTLSVNALSSVFVFGTTQLSKSPLQIVFFDPLKEEKHSGWLFQ